MRSVRWRKVFRDLLGHPMRTVLVVLSIAVGVFAVGTIAGADAMLQRNLTEVYAGSKPASALLFTAPFDKELVETVRRMRGIAEAEGRRNATVRLRADDGSYGEMLLTAIPDFEDQRLDLIDPERGGWPPGRGEVVIERSSLQLRPLVEGERLSIQTADGKLHDLTVRGISHEVGAAPAFYVGRIQGHVTPETLQDLGYDTTFDELHIKVADPTLDEAGIQAVTDEVAAKLERGGVTVFGSYVPVPGRHPANDLLQGFFLILGFIGALALVVSGFLVVNTVSAILAQQTRQIGVMKAIGARNDQIAGIYLGLVLVYAILALIVALPLGLLGAYAFTSFTAGLANFDVETVFLAPHVLALEIGVGLIVPLLAAAGAGHARCPRHHPRGARLDGHQRPVRPRTLGPTAARDPWPTAADVAVDPQHVPPQGSSAVDARRAGPRRRDLHVGLLASGRRWSRRSTIRSPTSPTTCKWSWPRPSERAC